MDSAIQRSLSGLMWLAEEQERFDLVSTIAALVTFHSVVFCAKSFFPTDLFFFFLLGVVAYLQYHRRVFCSYLASAIFRVLRYLYLWANDFLHRGSANDVARERRRKNFARPPLPLQPVV